MQHSTNTIHPMLLQAKQHGVRMIATDIDWTIRDPDNPRYDFSAIADICCQIKKKGIEFLLLTGRDASFRRDIVPLLQKYLKQNSVTSPMYAGCANGGSLYKITSRAIHTVYRYGLSVNEIDECNALISRSIVKLDLTHADFQSQGLNVFAGFLSLSWDEVIPDWILFRAKKYQGLLFCEATKVSFVLPKLSITKKRLIEMIRKQLPNRFSLKTDQEYGHITLKQTDDKFIDKILALEFVRKQKRINKEHVVVFGGGLDEIDKQMLTKYPYSFTNQQKFKEKNVTKPPYKLIGKSSPVALVYEAILYLIA